MKDNKLNIDLSFLYQEPLIGGFNTLDGDTGLIEWMTKYEEERLAFSKYIKKCSLEDFVYLIIVAFKNKFPNFVKLKGTFHSDFSMEETTELESYDSGFERADIAKLTLQMYIGPIKDEFDPGNRDMYEQKVSFEFKESIPAGAIKSALEGVEYEKSKGEEGTVYTLTDSPIAKLTLNGANLEIEVNEEKVFLYYVS